MTGNGQEPVNEKQTIDEAVSPSYIEEGRKNSHSFYLRSRDRLGNSLLPQFLW